MPKVVHFEIHAENPERAIKFYTNVFGWKINQWGKEPYWMVNTGENKPGDTYPGINGGLLIRKGKPPIEGQAVNSYVCTIGVDDLEKHLKNVKKEGGKQVVDTVTIPNIGTLAYCKDTEGNIFGIIQPSQNMKK